MEFDYIYADELDTMFSHGDFFCIPRELMKSRSYAKLSSGAKLLYGLLLDRMSTAEENDWCDADGKFYVECPVADVMEYLNCSERCARKYLVMLDDAGLIERRRKSCNSSKIYLNKIGNLAKE